MPLFAKKEKSLKQTKSHTHKRQKVMRIRNVLKLVQTMNINSKELIAESGLAIRKFELQSLDLCKYKHKIFRDKFL